MELSSLYKIISNDIRIGGYKSDFYNDVATLLKNYFYRHYGPTGECRDLEINGVPIYLPYTRMGNLDSVCLFGIDEVIIFYLYSVYLGSAKCILDIGANIGLHSIVLGRLGFENIYCFEPDPITFEQLQKNVQLNGLCEYVHPINAAMSETNGTVNFTRVHGNTMSSHISGSKSSPYGKLENFCVDSVDAADYFKEADLVKLDAESHELPILIRGLSNSKNRPEIILEVGADTNREKLFKLLKDSNYNILSQKKGWVEIKTCNDLPAGHLDGSVICTQSSFIANRLSLSC